jgi:hypothetical protein
VSDTPSVRAAPPAGKAQAQPVASPLRSGGRPGAAAPPRTQANPDDVGGE